MTKYGFHGNNLSVKNVSTGRVTVSDKVVVEYVIPYTIAYSTTNILDGINWHTGTVTYTNTTILMQPPYPAQLLVNAKVAGTAGHNDSITFVGLNAAGETITDIAYVSATAGSSLYTNKAFAKITSIYPTGKVIVKSTDLNVGIRTGVIGLPYPIASSADIISYQKGGTFATTAAITMNSTTYNTVAIATTAAKVVKILYKSIVQKNLKN